MLNRNSVGPIHCLKSIFVVLFTSKLTYAASVGCTDLHDFEVLGGDRVILSVHPHGIFLLRREGPFIFIFFFQERREGGMSGGEWVKYEIGLVRQGMILV